jgi:hypothetical protein
VSLAIAAGAYFRAKKGASELVSRVWRRRAGLVVVMVGVGLEGEEMDDGEEQIQTSSRPQVLRASSMMDRVSASEETE